MIKITREGEARGFTTTEEGSRANPVWVVSHSGMHLRDADVHTLQPSGSAGSFSQASFRSM